ncbi:MAG: cation-translocating P-type ATPase [Bdellovibrio sp.]|nr:cation-translocating P-type ATPase [Bdellovibrio sp.]
MEHKDDKNHNHDHDKPHTHSHCCDHDSVSQNPVTVLTAFANETLTTFKVSNMDCADEIKAINEALKMDGITRIQANLMSSTVQVVHAPEISPAFLKKRIETTVVRVITDNPNQTKDQNRKRIYIVAKSGVYLLAGLIIQWTNPQNFFASLCYIMAIGLGGWLVFPKAYGSLRRKTLDMNVLMTVAVIGAVCIGEMAEAAAVVFLFSLSELLESLSVQRARRAIQELLKITPQVAHAILADGTTQETEISAITIDQLIRVKAGESIPIDGLVVFGNSSVNQAPLTGESIPVLKTIGEIVYAGTVNQEGSLDVKVTKIFRDTKISQVIRLVEEAQSQRAVSQKFVDRFAEIYTPAVLALAALTFVLPPLFFAGSWHDWLYKALVLLVIACPCALVISTPVSIVSSLTALARKGVLVKGGAILEVLGKIKALAVDKTGTLTEGKPKVQQIIAMNLSSDEKILQIASSLEAHSTHPLAQAILNFGQERFIQTKMISEFKNVSGRGVEAIIEGHTYLLGNHRFAHEVGICTPELEKTLFDLEEKSLSVVVVGHKPHGDCTGQVLGIIALGDQVRADAKVSLQRIKSTGVETIIMLSGDNQKTATMIGQHVGIDQAFGDLLPEGKVAEIEKLKAKYQTVAMIGDGINDAPAMAKSSVGIAMGFVGSDTAIETADVALMTDDLNQVAVAIQAGRRTLRIIQFNIAFALITKAIFLVLTFLGYSNLWIAVAADTGAALLVILNSLRLLKVSEKPN